MTYPPNSNIEDSPQSSNPLTNPKPKTAFSSFWKKLDSHQKTGLVAITLVALSLPLGTIAAMNEVRQRSQAYLPISAPITPPTTPSPTPTSSPSYPTPSPTTSPTASPYPSATPISCARTLHTVTMSPTAQSGIAGSTLTYSATVTNRNSFNCGASYFTASSRLPRDDWWASFSPPTPLIAPGESKTITATFTSSTSTPIRVEGYPVGINVAGPEGTVTATSAYYVTTVSPSPTSSPYPTPTSTPQSTVVPSPSISPLPTPTPRPTISPKPNTNPIFMTRSIPTAVRNRKYNAVITTFDPDGDQVKISFSGLPAGLTHGGCSVSRFMFLRVSQCRISGIPTKAGTYTIHATAVDGRGGKATQKFTLKIR